MNEEEMAAAFYGSSTDTTPAVAAPARSDEEMAAVLYGKSTTAEAPATPQNGRQDATANPLTIQAKEQSADAHALDLVRNDPMRKIFSDEGSNGLLYDELIATDGVNGVPHDMAPVEGVDRAEFSSIVADHGASHADVREFLQDYREFSEAKLTEAHKQEFLADAIQGMKEKYGDGWEGAWDAAAALARRDPRVAKMLVESGLGADRKTVMRFAEEALRQRNDGRLK